MNQNVPIKNVHHVAFRCRDAEQTRWFYEDILGLKLAAAMSFDHLSGTDKKIEYMHIFFEYMINPTSFRFKTYETHNIDIFFVARKNYTLKLISASVKGLLITSFLSFFFCT